MRTRHPSTWCSMRSKRWPRANRSSWCSIRPPAIRIQAITPSTAPARRGASSPATVNSAAVASALNMWPGWLRRGCRAAPALGLALAAVPAIAQISPLTGQSVLYYRPSNAYGGNYLTVIGGVIYTDNVERTASGKGEALLLLGLSGDTTRQGTGLDYHLSSNLALLKYLGGTYQTEPSGYLDGKLAFHIVPAFFSWIARESFSGVQIDPY